MKWLLFIAVLCVILWIGGRIIRLRRKTNQPQPKMNLEEIAGVKIFRPSIPSEWNIRSLVEAEIRKNHKIGQYEDRDEINEILQELFGFYSSKLEETLPKIASRHLMDFVLKQYDFASQIESACKKGKASSEEIERWRALGPVFRRAAKHLAECIAIEAPVNEASPVEADQLVELFDIVWICAEQMVEFSILSSQTFSIFPESSKLEIFEPGNSVWIDLSIDRFSDYQNFQERAVTDFRNRKSIFDEKKLMYDTKRIADILDDPFLDSCGFSLSQAIEIVRKICDDTVMPAGGQEIPFVSREIILSSLVQDFKLAEDAATLLLQGICISEEAMKNEGRVVWKPKQEYRAFSRPFFEFPHSSGLHLTWSTEMAKECLLMLMTRLSQTSVPVEWQKGTVPKALEKYSSQISAEFENLVNTRLTEEGIVSAQFKNKIGSGSSEIQIPSIVGEIDTIGYWPSERLLIVGDSKVVKPTTEPQTFRDDIDKFVGKKKNYREQVLRKAQWVSDELSGVCAALASVKGFPETVKADRVAPALITYYPAVASLFFDDVACVSLTELILSIREQGKWPYALLK